MPPQASVRLFGCFKVEVEGKEVSIRTKPAQELLARLCVEPSKHLERTHVAADIWPDNDYAVSGNRLRTNLVILKQALAPWDPVHGDRTAVWLEDSAAHIDLHEASVRLRRVRLLQDLDQELDSTLELIKIIDQPLLEGFEEEWVRHLREFWSDQRTQSWIRVSQIREELGFLPEALQAAESALEGSPYDSAAWQRSLRLLALLDRSRDALERYAKVRNELPAEVEGVANRIRHGGVKPVRSSHRFSSSEQKLLLAALERMATHDRLGFLRILASQSFKEVVFQRPAVAFNMVVDFFDPTLADANLKTEVARTGINASLSLAEHEDTEKLCRVLIDEHTENEKDHIQGLRQLSFLKFEQRQMDEAFELGQRALSLAERFQPDLTLAMRAHLVALDWHMGRLDEAVEVYLEAIENFRDKPELTNRYNYVVMSGNLAFVRSLQNDWPATLEMARETWRFAGTEGFETVRAFIAPVFGLATIWGGDPSGAKHIVDALKTSYRSRSIRPTEIGLDYAAGALIKLGKPGLGLALLDAIVPLREARSHGRSIGENLLVAHLRAWAGDAKPTPQWDANPTLLDLVMAATEALEG